MSYEVVKLLLILWTKTLDEFCLVHIKVTKTAGNFCTIIFLQNRVLIFSMKDFCVIFII